MRACFYIGENSVGQDFDVSALLNVQWGNSRDYLYIIMQIYMLLKKAHTAFLNKKGLIL